MERIYPASLLQAIPWGDEYPLMCYNEVKQAGGEAR
jgi:hypothetical protein